MTLQNTYDDFDLAAEETVEWLGNEIATVRSGRVVPAILDSIQVEHYGAKTPLNGLASISSLDARTLSITPWDESAIQAIEKAVTEADLGVQPAVDGKIIRLAFPMLSEEMRDETAKQLHKTAEQARIRLRQSRDGALSALKKDKQTGDITEDEMHGGKKGLDQRIDTANKQVEEAISKKEADIRAI